MKSLFIIIHEDKVKDQHDKGIALGIRVYEEIQRIKQTQEFRLIDDNENPEQIPENLPSPDEYEIWVCGTRINLINNQITALEKAGYRVRLYLPGSIY